MPKISTVKKLQKQKAVIACFAFVDLDSSEEYINSSSNSDESSDNGFMITKKNKAFREVAKKSLKISSFFTNNQLSTTNYEENAEDFQVQEYQ
ncbi:6408_t:CDS:2, partial [Dentiscutata erythropus]